MQILPCVDFVANVEYWSQGILTDQINIYTLGASRILSKFAKV